MSVTLRYERNARGVSISLNFIACCATGPGHGQRQSLLISFGKLIFPDGVYFPDGSIHPQRFAFLISGSLADSALYCLSLPALKKCGQRQTIHQLKGFPVRGHHTAGQVGTFH